MSDDARTAVLSEKAPKPVSFLSQANVIGGIVFCSGQIAANPETGALVEGTVGDRTKQILTNLKNVLEAAGSGMDLVAKCNIFLTNPDDFAPMNAVYETFFSAPMPARTCVFVKALPLGTDVEIECVGKVSAAKASI